MNSLDVVERKTPQEVLQEQAEEMMSEIEKVKILWDPVGKYNLTCLKPISFKLIQITRGVI